MFIPYIIIEWGYSDKWKQVSPIDDCPAAMLRNVTSALVEAGYRPFAEDEQSEANRRTWAMLDPTEGDRGPGQNVIWKHRASAKSGLSTSWVEKHYHPEIQILL